MRPSHFANAVGAPSELRPCARSSASSFRNGGEFLLLPLKLVYEHWDQLLIFHRLHFAGSRAGHQVRVDGRDLFGDQAVMRHLPRVVLVGEGLDASALTPSAVLLFPPVLLTSALARYPIAFGRQPLISSPARHALRCRRALDGRGGP